MRITESFTWHRVWLYHLYSHASANAFSSTTSSGWCRMFKRVSYGKDDGAVIGASCLLVSYNHIDVTYIYVFNCSWPMHRSSAPVQPAVYQTPRPSEQRIPRQFPDVDRGAAAV